MRPCILSSGGATVADNVLKSTPRKTKARRGVRSDPGTFKSHRLEPPGLFGNHKYVGIESRHGWVGGGQCPFGNQGIDLCQQSFSFYWISWEIYKTREVGQRGQGDPMPPQSDFQNSLVPRGQGQVVPGEVQQACSDRQVRPAAWTPWRRGKMAACHRGRGHD